MREDELSALVRLGEHTIEDGASRRILILLLVFASRQTTRRTTDVC